MRGAYFRRIFGRVHTGRGRFESFAAYTVSYNPSPYSALKASDGIYCTISGVLRQTFGLARQTSARFAKIGGA